MGSTLNTVETTEELSLGLTITKLWSGPILNIKLQFVIRLLPALNFLLPPCVLFIYSTKYKCDIGKYSGFTPFLQLLSNVNDCGAF